MIRLPGVIRAAYRVKVCSACQVSRFRTNPCHASVQDRTGAAPHGPHAPRAWPRPLRHWSLPIRKLENTSSRPTRAAFAPCTRSRGRWSRARARCSSSAWRARIPRGRADLFAGIGRRMVGAARACASRPDQAHAPAHAPVPHPTAACVHRAHPCRQEASCCSGRARHGSLDRSRRQKRRAPSIPPLITRTPRPTAEARPTPPPGAAACAGAARDAAAGLAAASATARPGHRARHHRREGY